MLLVLYKLHNKEMMGVDCNDGKKLLEEIYGGSLEDGDVLLYDNLYYMRDLKELCEGLFKLGVKGKDGKDSYRTLVECDARNGCLLYVGDDGKVYCACAYDHKKEEIDKQKNVKRFESIKNSSLYEKYFYVEPEAYEPPPPPKPELKPEEKVFDIHSIKTREDKIAERIASSTDLIHEVIANDKWLQGDSEKNE